MTQGVKASYEAGCVPIEHSAWPEAQGSAQFPALEHDIDTAFLVIGAGLAGASLALHLAERGCDVAVLEARQPGEGASGRNAGHVQPTFGSPASFSAWPDGGARFTDYLVHHRDIVFDLCKRHGIDGDAHRCGSVEVATRAWAVLERNAARWRARGYEVDMLGRDALRALLGSDRYACGLHWREGGRVNPHRFTHGLAASAARLGARVFGDSPVLGCERVGGVWRARTPRGQVSARQLIVCTNGHAANTFFPQLAQTAHPLLACGLATRPLPHALLDHINPARVAISQVPLGLYPLVIDARGRLITATIPAAGRAHDARRHFDDLLRYLHRTWPVTRGAAIELETYWTGMTASSSASHDASVPQLYRVADGVLALMNLGTWGNLLGPLLGMNLAHALADDRPQDLVLPVSEPVPAARPQGLEFSIRRIMIPAARMIDRFGPAWLKA